MPHVDRLGGVVEDRRLDRPAEELLRVAAEELVEAVLAGDVERQPRALAAAGAAPLLAQAGDGPREGDRDRGIEMADVDAQLQRVGGDDARQLAARELPFDLAPLLGRVAGPVGGDRAGVVEPLGGELVDQLGALARAREADRAHAGRDEVGEQHAPPRSAPRRAGRCARRAAAGCRAPPRGRRTVRRRCRSARSRARSGRWPARPGWRSSPRSSRTAARCRRRGRSAAAGAARCRRASRTRHGRCAPRRRPPAPGWRRSRPRTGGWAGCRRAACRGWSAPGSSAAGSRCGPPWACRRRRSPGAGRAASDPASQRDWSWASAFDG